MLELKKEGLAWNLYRLGSYGCNTAPLTHTDLCRYINRILFGILGLVWDTAIWCGFLFALIYPFTLGGIGVYWGLLLQPVLIVGLVCGGFVGIAWLIYWCVGYSAEHKGPVAKIITSAYDGWKNNFCPLIKFNEKDKNDE